MKRRRVVEMTVKEFAALERVNIRTVKTWIEKGAVQVRRTPGGGVRVLVDRATDLLVLAPRSKGK
jgi:predicted site-specific integrase-resolvase